MIEDEYWNSRIKEQWEQWFNAKQALRTARESYLPGSSRELVVNACERQIRVASDNMRAILRQRRYLRANLRS